MYVHLIQRDSLKDYKANLSLVRNLCCDISTCSSISLISKHAGIVTICDTPNFPSLWSAKIHILPEWRNSCWIQLYSQPFIKYLPLVLQILFNKYTYPFLCDGILTCFILWWIQLPKWFQERMPQNVLYQWFCYLERKTNQPCCQMPYFSSIPHSYHYVLFYQHALTLEDCSQLLS